MAGCHCSSRWRLCSVLCFPLELNFHLTPQNKFAFSQDFGEEFQRQLNEATSRGYGGATLALDCLAIGKLFRNFTIRRRNVL
jgi:hypothetical protein